MAHSKAVPKVRPILPRPRPPRSYLRGQTTCHFPFLLYRLVWLGLEGIQEHTRGRERIGLAGALCSALFTIFCHQDWPHSWSRLPMCEGYTSLVDPVKITKTAVEHFAYN